MPIRVPDSLPARAVLESENVFVMTEDRADHQEIRPLKLLILNLMPTKIATETQLLRCLSNSPLQVEMDLLQTVSYQPRNVSEEHLLKFYNTFDKFRGNRYDGMIITGAPVETMDFEDVAYWPELCEIMDWSTTHVQSVLHICWGAQAALYHFYGIPKYPLKAKMFGIFEHTTLSHSHPLTRGFDDVFLAPHSRHTEVRTADVLAHDELELLADSDAAGCYLAVSRDGRRVFATGHPEYDADTIAREYFRDKAKGLDIALPYNYFPGDDAGREPRKTWRSHANLLYANWLNYCVYQVTPYNLEEIGQ
ncbi:homoserine O-succinyltransferase [Clostridia bacterium]|nr:homoserine O-succinyltransferase [Clostridia bacterium]